jgi:gamma-glutamyltranspeptidase
MRAAVKIFLLAFVSRPLAVDTEQVANARQTADTQPNDTTVGTRQMRPVLRGRDYAVSSMKAEATAAAVRILDTGGNAFDAIVAGQAVLSLVDPDSNGFGSDAQILLYDAKKKEVVAIDADGTAPKLPHLRPAARDSSGWRLLSINGEVAT